jgi:hypothetical protein
MQGYNPSASLLPAGGGAIHAMSGGGMGGMPPTPAYNPSASLLPSVGGEVAAYRGGFFADDMGFIGGNTPTPAGAAPAPAPPTPAPPTPTPAPPTPTPAPPTPAPPTPTPAPAANAAAQPAPAPSANAGLDPKKKSIMLFGKTIELEDPNNIKGGIFTNAQEETLKVFGLDGPGLSDTEKKKILISLYEGQCNTAKSLIFQVDCEPMRQIVQSLALSLLGKIKEHEAKGDEVNEKAGNPKVTAEKVGDKNFRVSIEFTPAQMPLLSKYKVEEFVQSKRTNKPKKANAASSASSAPDQTIMEIKPRDITKGGSDVITALGIKNPKFWCYAIAAIQLMFSMPQMREAFSNLGCTKPLSMPSDPKYIEALTAIDSNDTLCVLKWAFGELSQITTKFSDADYASKIIGNKTIPVNTPILYIMKKFLLEQMKSDKDSKGDTNKQQDVAEFLRIIFNIIDNNNTLKTVLDRFRFKVIKTYECENKQIKKQPLPAVSDLFLQLHINDYTKNSSPELQNKKKKDVGGLSLQNLIEYYSRNQVPTITSQNLTRDMIDGCGDDGVGKGYGTYSEQIEVDDTNDYLIINPTKATDSGRPSWQDTSVKIKAEALITVAENRYTIFGAILYSGSGEGGHYVYQRLYADGTADINADTDINKLPFIMYNTGTTTANNTQGYTILDNATLIIYKRVRGGGAAAAASSSNSKEAMANADKVDNQLTEDEKTRMSISSNRIQEIAGATGLTVEAIRKILEDKEIEEYGGASAAAAPPGAAAPEPPAGAAPAAAATSGASAAAEAAPEPPAGAAPRRNNAPGTAPAAEAAAASGASAAAEAAPAAPASAPKASATDEGRAETGASAAPPPGASAAAPSNPAENNQRGRGAPKPNFNRLHEARSAYAASRATNKTGTRERPVSPPTPKQPAQDEPQMNEAVRKNAALKKALEKRSKTGISKVFSRGLTEEEKELLREHNEKEETAKKGAEIEKATAEIFSLYEQEKNIDKNISESKKKIESLNAEAVQLGRAGNTDKAIHKVAQRIQEQKVLDTARATRNARYKIIHDKRLALQRKYSDIITPEQEEDLKREVEGMADSGSSGSAKGGGKHRKTATKSKAKTKTFKKHPSKKRANKTFKRRK